jgi:preprotein translocase subunit SecE
VDPKKITGGISRFFRDVWAELKRVAWPSRRQLQIYTLVVIASVIVVSVILFVFDFILAEAMVKPLFGR